MKNEYDFSKMKGQKNPYASKLKEMAKASGIPYQSLINLYLRDCAASGRKLEMTWE
jgi:predicted DNA binding CopG/RHH family protein